ncbi:hypothetical protein V6N13_085195 [Hibiscus sabdariffa]
MIPQQIGNLKNLEILSLGYNNLVGPIPPAIFNTSTLSVIDLESNRLSGSLPSNIGLWLPNLEELYLGSNQLVGSFPMYISNASRLTVLDMPHNYISGSIPDTLGSLRNLERLNLEANNLTSSGMGFLSSLTNCPRLQLLSFGNNKLITGKLLGSVGNLSASLQIFIAARCNIRGSIPESFVDLMNLESLDLSANNISGEIPKSLEKLRHLKYFNVSFNRLEGEILGGGSFANWKDVTNLDFSGNNLSAAVTTPI